MEEEQAVTDRKLYSSDVCDEQHDLTGANGLKVNEALKMCRTCRGIGNRSYGSEWRNHRGQVFVFIPDHPYSRKDGFYPRARSVMEGHVGRLLEPQERVLHYPEQRPDADDPLNLMLFPSQHALAQFLSETYQAKKERLGGGWAALTPAQREYQEAKANERILQRENDEKAAAKQRSIDALKAHNAKKAK